MEVEKPHPAPPPSSSHPGPALGFQVTSRYIWGSLLGAGPSHFQGPGSAWTGHRSARADSCPGTRKRGGVGRRPPPLPGRPPGIQAGTWPAGAWGWGKLVISAPASSFHTPSLSLAPRPLLSLLQPPGANIISPSLPFLVFPPLTLRSTPPPAPGRSPLGKSFHLNPLRPALNVSPVSFPRVTCMVKPRPEPWHLATGDLVDSDGLCVGGPGGSVPAPPEGSLRELQLSRLVGGVDRE